MPQPEGAQAAALALAPVVLLDAKDEIFLWHWSLWHLGHSTGWPLDMDRTNLSNTAPHTSHSYS